jgi:hypothetical protein
MCSENPKTPNHDNESLDPVHRGGFVIGFVDEVKRANGQEVKGHPLTRYELLQLARYWYLKTLDFSLEWFLFRQVTSSLSGIQNFAWLRLTLIEQLLGEEAVDHELKEVENEKRRELGDRLWRIFTEGTAEEREQVWQEQVRQEIESSKGCQKG